MLMREYFIDYFPKGWLAVWGTSFNVGPCNGYDWRRYTLLTAGPAAGFWARGAVHRELLELYTLPVNEIVCLRICHTSPLYVYFIFRSYVIF